MIDRPAWLEVNLSALARNIRAISSRIGPGPSLCAVVKADAYGHGAVPVAREALEAGASSLAVAIVPEGEELRRAGFTAPILVLGPTAFEDIPAIVDYDLTTPVFTAREASALSEAAAKRHVKAKVHLKIDTGLCRIGCAPKDASYLAVHVASLPGLELEGCFSHFASTEPGNRDFARHQLEVFTSACDAIEAEGIELRVRHIANSAAALDMPEARLDMVRVGIALFGIAPSAEIFPERFGLEPVMALRARILFIKEVPASTPVGYGCSFVTSRPSRIATLPLGYADGYPRSLSNKGKIGACGRLVPLAGRVCMDQCMIDVTDLPELREGDEVVLFGPGGPSVDELAASAGTISNEIVSRMGARLPRRYFNGSM